MQFTQDLIDTPFIYSSLTDLRYYSKHKKRHDRPLVCEASLPCPHTFAEEKDRTKHYWSIHKEWAVANGVKAIAIRCHLCHDKLSRPDYLPRHLKSLKCKARSRKLQENKLDSGNETVGD